MQKSFEYMSFSEAINRLLCYCFIIMKRQIAAQEKAAGKAEQKRRSAPER
jgi:hypothetical protein